MQKALIAAGAVLAAASAANADYTVNLGTMTLTGGQSVSVTTANLTGTLTGFTIAFGYDPQASSGSWASDAALVIDGKQWGGFNVVFGGATSQGQWAFDGSGSANAGFYSDAKSTTGNYNGSAGANLIFGNGWATSGAVVYSNVTVVLQGVVPAPGAFALLGLAGFASRRRRA